MASPAKSNYFSTITQKAEVPNESQRNQEQTRIVEKLKSIIPPEESGPVKYIKIATSVAFGPQITMKDRLTFTNQTTIQLILGKKGKMMGKPVFREITLSRTETDLLSISQEKHNKSYAAPTEFTAETKDDFRQRSVSVAGKVDKKKTLPWDGKEIADCSYRIMFKRDGSESDKEPDTAFYFKFRDDFEKTKNYLKFIKLLEIDNTNPEKPNIVLERLAMSFRETITAKLRNLIQMRAEAINTELRRDREKTMQVSLTLNELDKRLVRGLVTSWSKYIIDSELYKQEQERLAQERKRGIESSLKQSNLLKTFDDDLVRHFTRDWKSRLEARYATDRRDIKVFFNTLELVSDVIQPTIKLEIRFKKEYPEIPVVNGVQILNKFIEYNLSCQLKYSKSTKVSCWNIYPSAHKPSDIKSPTQPLNKQASGPLNQPNISRDDQFFLQFSGFRADYLDCAEIKVILYDETSTIMGYHYAVLKSMYTVVNRGNELWLCLKVSSEGRTKFPLINLNITANPLTHNVSQEENIESVAQNHEFIEDTFYNYRFKFPVITPKQIRLVELVPATWDIIDKKSRSPPKTKTAPNPEQVQDIRSKLYSHYYQNTTRQIAHLTRSAYLWGELQDELMSIASQEKNPNKEQIYIDEQYLKRLVRNQLGLEEGESSEQPSENLDNAVSFLFKKDQWETRAEWGNLHEKLKKICRKGIPSQYRINLWSELGKVVYFVELTEAVLRQGGQYEGEGENFMEKSKKVYEILLRKSERENSQLYQALEDDIVFLAGSQGREGLVHEKYLRKICRSFIMWTKIMNGDSIQSNKAKYNVVYSRDLLTLCYGLIVCQTCRYIEERVVIEEDQVFWLLVSISSYILATYYETNEEAVGVDTLITKQVDQNAETKKKNSLGYSALRCNRIKGIKNDLLLLKVMLKESEKDIYYKFEELGLPLEYYFAEHMTTLFINLFNPGLVFRCWDIIFFEGSGTNGARCNKLIVCVLYTVLKECKQQIMKVKKPEDLKFIIELFGRFHTKYGDLIKKAYNALATCLEVSLPANPSMIDRLAHLKHVIFTDIHKNINKDIKAIEKRLENHYNSIYQQNIAIYNLVNTRYAYTPGQESEVLSYPILSRMIKDLKTALLADRNALHKKSERFIHLKIHEILLGDQAHENVNVSIIFGQEKMARNFINPCNCNIDVGFAVSQPDDLNQDLHIEVSSQNNTIIGSLNVHVKSFAAGVAAKVHLKLENNDIKVHENASASEVSLSIVVQEGDFEEGIEGYQPLILPELENPTYKALRKAKFGNTSEPADKSDSDATPENSPLSRKEGENLSINYQNPCTKWKERFVLTYEAFVGIIKTISPAWIDAANLHAIYNAMLQANMPRKFYITDFFVLIILFAKLTLNQRTSLLFDLYKGLSSISNDTGVSTNAFKGLLAHIYEVFMVYIPQNEVENMIDLAIGDTTCYVRKVVLNGKQKLNVEYPKQMLNRIANYMHVYAGTRGVYIYSQSMVKMLREYYEKEMAVNFQDKSGPPQTRNELKISYVTNCMSHEIRLYIDENWRLIEDPQKEGIEDVRLYRTIGHNYNTLSLTNTPVALTQEKFSAVLQKLPLIDYLCSLENTNTENLFTSIHDIKFTVTIGGETVYTTKPSFSASTEGRNQPPPSSSRVLRTQIRKFPYYLENWEGTVRHSHNLIKRSIDTGDDIKGGYIALEGTTAMERLNIYMPYTQIARTIKKNLIKTVSDILDKSKEYIKRLHPNLFDANLWNLDYDVSIKVNNSHILTVNEVASTPFSTLVSSLDQKDVQSVEVIFALWDQAPAQDKKRRYHHSATYKYADGSQDWLACEIQFVYHRGNTGDKTIGELSNKEFEGYGVVFEKFPNETVLKQKHEVAVAYKIDLTKLELRRLEEKTN